MQTESLVFGGVFSVALSIDATSTFEIGNAGTAAAGALTIDPGHTLTAPATSEDSEIENTVVNNGSLVAFDLSIDGLAGTGAVQISQGASLQIDGAILSTQAIALAGNAQLVLSNSNSDVSFRLGDQTLSATSSITLAGTGGAVAKVVEIGNGVISELFNDS